MQGLVLRRSTGLLLPVRRQIKLASSGAQLISRTCTHTSPPIFLGSAVCVCVCLYTYAFRLVCLFFHRNLDLKEVGIACSHLGLGRCSREHGKTIGNLFHNHVLTFTSFGTISSIINTTLQSSEQPWQYELQLANPVFSEFTQRYLD